MDHKELIERLRDLAVYTREEYNETAVEDAMFEAADAIEKLLAEREAAIADLTSICEDSGDACHLCKHLPCAPKHDRCIGWEWRGPTPPDRQKTKNRKRGDTYVNQNHPI